MGGCLSIRIRENVMKCINVKCEGKPAYDIVIESGFGGLSEAFNKLEITGRKLCIVTDSNVGPLYAEQVKNELEKTGNTVYVYTFAAGEENKTLDTVQDVYEYLIENHFDRNDCLVALGGGVVGDLTGFSAATYLRGIKFIQVPTSLLAQVDSSIGGKTGVDFRAYKNMVGAFHQPKLVYMNVSTLSTMDERDYLSGMGEVVKHGLIRDKKFFDWLKINHEKICSQDNETLIEMDYHNCRIKGEVVEKDPTEQGIRSLLNFGHTLGHAIEKQKAGELYHGECVSIGAAAAAYISMKRGYLTKDDLQTVLDAFTSFKLPITVTGVDKEAALAATKSDKKMQGNQIRFILLKSLGEAVVDKTVTMDEMREALDFVCQDA